MGATEVDDCNSKAMGASFHGQNGSLEVGLEGQILDNVRGQQGVGTLDSSSSFYLGSKDEAGMKDSRDEATVSCNDEQSNCPAVDAATDSVPENMLQVKVVPIECRLYPERWWILVAVVLLNISNSAHWVAFPVVAKTVAKHYDQRGERIDLIPTLSYGLGVPCSIFATYITERYGLKHVLYIGAFLTGIGGLLCFLSSIQVAFMMSHEVAFQLALIGQALTGIGFPFIASVPTKISQHWFSDSQRVLATVLLGMSSSIGCIFGQGLTPLFVHKPEDVLMMNLVWFIPAAVGALLTAWKVRRSYPPLPPSPSAAIRPKARSIKDWMHNIKILFLNPAYAIIFLFLGACMGGVNTFLTKTEQMLCARGYTDQLAGLAGALILACAPISAIFISQLAQKFGHSVLICKVLFFIGLIPVLTNAFVMSLRGQEIAIVMSNVWIGLLAAGSYPLALELVVECTYPIDQVTSMAFIFLSNSMQGVFLMGMENVLNDELDEENMKFQTCVDSGDTGHQQPRDYTRYLYFLAGYVWFILLIFLIFFKTEMKRTLADRNQIQSSLNDNDFFKEVEAHIELPIFKYSSQLSALNQSESVNGSAPKDMLPIENQGNMAHLEAEAVQLLQVKESVSSST